MIDPTDETVNENIGFHQDSKNFLKFNDYMILLTKQIPDSRLEGLSTLLLRMKKKLFGALKIIRTAALS